MHPKEAPVYVQIRVLITAGAVGKVEQIISINRDTWEILGCSLPLPTGEDPTSFLLNPLISLYITEKLL